MTLPDFAVSPEPLARRSTSVLYRARRTADGRAVVLKVASTEGEDGEGTASVVREDAIGSRIDAPSVVATFGLTRAFGRCALVREDFGGVSLDALTGTPMEMGRFLDFACGIAQALVEIHAYGIIHRDVKPSNVIVREAPLVVKLTDFGIASAPWVDATSETPGFVGTLAYAAPEQTGRMNRVADQRADLYSAGVTFYELLAGARPFEARDPLEWIHFHLARKPEKPSILRPEVPEVIERIVLVLLAKAPEDRYQSARGLLEDLERCRAALAAHGTVAPFPLRRADIPDTFQVPQRLRGRAVELEQLRGAFEDARTSASPVVALVSGYSGIGKSSAVAELHPHVAAHGGFFASGKFDQLRRHVPYAAFAGALRELVDQVLSATGGRLAAWREAVSEALGVNARVLLDVFPDLERLVPGGAAVAALGPAETQNRFHLVFRTFLETVATSEHPLVLFLDDMQWADAPSLALLQEACEGTRCALLLVLAFRDNEVAPDHPFALTTARLRASGTRVTDLALGPLDEGCVRAIVAATLHASEDASSRLASMVAQKTAGNPFFVNEFLRALYLDGLLRFDREAQRWSWSTEEIEARSVTDNVVDLIIARLAKLPPETVDVLRTASCIGGTFDVETLATASASEREAVIAALRPAVEERLVVVRPDSDIARYQFGHDRIQQAAFSLVADADRPALHLRIARHLLVGLSAEGLETKLFDVVNHFGEALDLVSDAAERDHVRRLNESAGRKARGATAFAQARVYLATASRLTPSRAWEERYEEVFALERDLAECEYLVGDLDAARARFEALLATAASDLHRAQVFYLQMRLLQVAGDYQGACDVALRSFEAFGLTPPTPEGAAAACAEEDAEAERLLAGFATIEELASAKRLEDPRLRALADLLESSGPPIYMVRPELFAWITLKLLVLSLRHGNCEASCYAYGIYALMRAAGKGDVEGGYAFAMLALQLNERLGDVRLRGCMLHLLGDHVNFWKNHVASDLPILDRGFQACLEGGDLIYSSYIAFQSPWHAYESGMPIDDVLRLTAKYLPFAARTNQAVHRTIRLEEQFLRDLKGLTIERGTFTDGAFDEAEAVRTIENAKFGCGIVYRHILVMIARFTSGDAAGAERAGQQAEEWIGAAFSMPIETSFHLYRALVAAALADQGDPEVRLARRRRVEDEAASFRRWAAACPANFEDKAALIEAELARISGRSEDAMRSYDCAASAARRSGFTHYEALASELAAAFYAGIGAHGVAATLYADAHALYRQWGAHGKATQLCELRPELRSTPGPLGSWPSSTASSNSSRMSFDLLPVVKASQSLSEEMVLARLLERLMGIVIEYAGAQRGVLCLVENGQTRVAASAAIDRARGDAAAVPMSIVHFVERTRERVLLDDASLPNVFSSDPYMAERRPRSVLCVPIVRRHKLTGVFYLENDLVTRAFSPERLAVLDILASQTAISIDNARLFEGAQEAIAVRDQFLSLASHELKTPLTPLKLRLESLAETIRAGTLAKVPEARLLSLAQSIDVQMARLGHLVDTLLDASRVGGGNTTLDRADVDLAAVTRDVVARHRTALERASCPVTLAATSPVVGHWDRSDLELIVASLLTNAMRHAAGAPIEISVNRVGEHAVLVVQDHGPGLGTTDAAKLFDRFTQGAGHGLGGLGLGLYLVRHSVEAHGGRIFAESDVGTGARFVVELPAPYAVPS